MYYEVVQNFNTQLRSLQMQKTIPTILSITPQWPIFSIFNKIQSPSFPRKNEVGISELQAYRLNTDTQSKSLKISEIVMAYAISYSVLISFSFCGPPRPSGTPPMEGNYQNEAITIDN